MNLNSTKSRSLLSLLVFFVGIELSDAQEFLKPLNYNPAKLHVQTDQSPQTAGTRSDTLDLPFFDDFSIRSIYPDPAKWTDRHVYINRVYAANPQTLGVATFDGLNEFGLPHVDSLNPGPDGPADTLTSQPIRMGGLSASDSVFLSFMYQPQGLGDWPNLGDSLLLEVLWNGTEWRKIWGVDGFTSGVQDPKFETVILYLDDDFFFYDGFQFRFRNYATITGNNDHWHVDYVILDANRTSEDTIKNDASFLFEPENILANYRSMPWRHFYDYQETEVKDQYAITFRNNFNAPKNTTYEIEVTEQNSGTLIYTDQPIAFNFMAYSNQSIVFDTDKLLPFDDFATLNNNDSVVIRVKNFINPSGDVNPRNDTAFTDHLFYNYFAYDDGNAEKAYGVDGVGQKGFAMRFDLNEQDTIRAVKIHFAQILEDVSDVLFNLMIWKEIDSENTGEGDSVLYIGDFKRPYYINERNGFTIYVPEEELVVDGSFYIGWVQTAERNLQVGFDLSRNNSERMYYQSNGIWYSSQVNGTPMIRLAVGPDEGYIPTTVEEPMTVEKINSFSVYPNPTNNLLLIEHHAQKFNESSYRIFDLTGRLIKNGHIQQNKHQLNVRHLPKGVYMLEIINQQTGKREMHRWVRG